MLRVALPAALTAGLVALAGTSVAQPPKDQAKPNAPPRIAVADPADANKDPDFLIQGEYGGVVETKPDVKRGMQIVAEGGGRFTVVTHKGGLPGAGSTERRLTPFTLVRNGDKAEDKKGLMVVPGSKEAIVGTADNPISRLKRVERTSPSLGATPPEGAVILFGKPGDEKNWTGGKLVKLSDGEFLGNGMTSKQTFGSFKAHVEFRLAWMPNSRGQGRSNSGVYVQDRYEIQVLDSFGLKGENNECGGLYTQYKPLVNMCLPPLVWQTYDIDFTAAEFDGDKKTKPARLTVVHNGVKIHDHVELKGPTGGGQPEKPTPGPIQLQNHGDPVVYRNIWVVETAPPAAKPLPPVEARKQIGATITVEMTVKVAKDRLEKRGEIYLDAEEDFRDEKSFAVVISKAGAASLKAAGIDDPAAHFQGKTIRATGPVTEVDGVPRIDVNDAKQITVVSAK